MPKVHNTRRQNAAELLRMCKHGPSLSIEAFGIDGVKLSSTDRKIVNEYFIYHYRLWSDTWIIPKINELVPELKVDKPALKD